MPARTVAVVPSRNVRAVTLIVVALAASTFLVGRLLVGRIVVQSPPHVHPAHAVRADHQQESRQTALELASTTDPANGVARGSVERLPAVQNSDIVERPEIKGRRRKREEGTQQKDDVREGSPGDALKPLGTAPLSLPLEPPFRVVQLGQPRSGSTYQYHLLEAIVRLKSPSNVDVQSRFINRIGWNETEVMQQVTNGTSFVYKAHHERDSMKTLQQRGFVAFFTSGGIGKVPALYNQDRELLQKCSLCEIDRYRPFFGLTDDEVGLLKRHMAGYEKIRQCCGMQMSKYQVLRLNGCNVTQYVGRPDYPHCERENMTKIEIEFNASPIPYHGLHGRFNWEQPGDCARFDAEISSGKGFNGMSFTGCDRYLKRMERMAKEKLKERKKKKKRKKKNAETE